MRHEVNSGLKKSLYDSYKLAIRWASDRIEEQGDHRLCDQWIFH